MAQKSRTPIILVMWSWKIIIIFNRSNYQRSCGHSDSTSPTYYKKLAGPIILITSFLLFNTDLPRFCNILIMELGRSHAAHIFEWILNGGILLEYFVSFIFETTRLCVLTDDVIYSFTPNKKCIYDSILENSFFLQR